MQSAKLLGARRIALQRLLAASLGLGSIGLVLEVGLRAVHGWRDSSRLVYPRVANDINGFRDPSFTPHVPEGHFRILTLGASAFVTRDFPRRFEDSLSNAPFFRQRGTRPRVVSTGVPAHMTFDSMWKYDHWYRGYDFDLVIFYHGINDARANNYPAAHFRDDYTQLPYYRRFAPMFDWIERHPALSRSFTLTWGLSLFRSASLRLAPAFQREAPYNDPRDDPWLTEGATIKTAPIFEANLRGVLRLADERGQRLLLLTYAYHLPEDYTHERFQARQTGYTFMEESVATEVWGLPENVVRAIEAHNAVVRKVAASRPDVLFFDMERFMPKDREHFIDICHWTDLGRERFTQGVLQALGSLPDTE